MPRSAAVLWMFSRISDNGHPFVFIKLLPVSYQIYRTLPSPNEKGALTEKTRCVPPYRGDPEEGPVNTVTSPTMVVRPVRPHIPCAVTRTRASC